MKPSAIEVLQILMWLEREEKIVTYPVEAKKQTIYHLRQWLWNELQKYAEERAN